MKSLCSHWEYNGVGLSRVDSSCGISGLNSYCGLVYFYRSKGMADMKWFQLYACVFSSLSLYIHVNTKLGLSQDTTESRGPRMPWTVDPCATAVSAESGQSYISNW